MLRYKGAECVCVRCRVCGTRKIAMHATGSPEYHPAADKRHAPCVLSTRTHVLVYYILAHTICAMCTLFIIRNSINIVYSCVLQSIHIKVHLPRIFSYRGSMTFAHPSSQTQLGALGAAAQPHNSSAHTFTGRLPPHRTAQARGAIDFCHARAASQYLCQRVCCKSCANPNGKICSFICTIITIIINIF